MGNQIKDNLADGALQLGAWLNLTSPITAEIAGQAGFDWCLIDAEHGANAIDQIRSQLIGLQAAGCLAAVRVADNQPWMLKQALDAGALTLVVPMVNTAEEARLAAHAVRYPPQGGRGLAAGVVRASGYGRDTGYASRANADVCLMVQAETRSAVEAIDEIAAVDGVDAVFVGPSDLAADMGYPGDIQASEVQEAIAHVMARTQAAGKWVGMFCLNPAELTRYRNLGAQFIAVASDVGLFRQAMATRAAEARSALSG